jgi:hypothetical protein
MDQNQANGLGVIRTNIAKSDMRWADQSQTQGKLLQELAISHGRD